MAKKKLREDKTCLNCGAHVDSTFCPECGQKNTDNERVFYKLFTEFFSAMFNYDNTVWRTAYNLFLSPGKLSKEYINGKRNAYIKPVQLYLFASFIAFFIPDIIPDGNSVHDDPPIKYSEESGDFITHGNDVIKPINFLSEYGKVSTRAELDSIYNSWPKEKRSSGKHLLATITVRIIQNYQKSSSFGNRIISFAVDNFPKVIFIYMPFFAFLLWLFHGKKRWYYYDSGIFTLHFFTLVLLVITILNILRPVFCNLLGWDTFFDIFVMLAGILYITFYFYRAHHVFYGENKWISRLKASALIMINTIIIPIVLGIFFLLAVLL